MNAILLVRKRRFPFGSTWPASSACGFTASRAMTTSLAPGWSAEQTRATCQLRPAIEERWRQYKSFRDVARTTSCKFSLVLSQALFVLLA